MKNLYKNMQLNLLLLVTTNLLQGQINADQKNIKELPLHKIILSQDYTTQEKINLIEGFLDDENIDINMQDMDGKTALNLITFYKGDPLLAELLIKKYKANVNTPDRFNVSPLHNAMEKEEIEIAKMLLDAGADQDLKNDADEITPVDLARSEKTMSVPGIEHKNNNN